jgi:DNA topoisomerase-1
VRASGTSRAGAAVEGGAPDLREAAAVADEAVLTAAAEAGLRYVTDEEPGIRRVKRGKGFSYTRAGGRSVVGKEARQRIEQLVIPPAWTDVWICADPNGHLQATGRDARGRKQYRYHDRWRAVRDEAKFDHLAEFGQQLPQLRAVVDEDLNRRGLPPRKVVALVVSLLDRTLIRVGNEEYRRDNGTYGLTTLRWNQVDVEGAEISFCFIGKGGLEHEVSLDDRRLARAVKACHELGGRELFTYRGVDGAPVRVDSADCNEYLADVMGPRTTVKYFRTWGATTTVLEELVERPAGLGASDVVAAIDVAAERLGNTRAVCRRSYVHPLLTDDLDEERLRDAWASSRTTESMTRSERATLRLLEG